MKVICSHARACINFSCPHKILHTVFSYSFDEPKITCMNYTCNGYPEGKLCIEVVYNNG